VIENGPEPLVAAAVVEVARELGRAASPQELLATPVLVPDIASHAVLTGLDHAIIEDLHALAAVCRQPHDRLGVEHVLLGAPQVRRVPVAGLVRLASHSEEWAAVEFNRVIPERLLAQRYVENYDFFENQIAAQLVDRLRRYLAGRIRDLTSLRTHLADLTEYQKVLQARQSHWKLQRLATLLAEAADDSQRQSEPVKAALNRLTELYTSVNLLRGSPLYYRANRRALIPFRLPRTNLLTRDRRYHRTATLWEAWALRETREIATLEHNQREFPKAYSAYVAAIALRACSILGLAPVNTGMPLTDEAPLDLGTEDGARLRLHVTEGTNTELSSGGVPLARIVALAEDLTADPSAARVEEALTRTFLMCRATETPTVVAYPGRPAGRADLPPKLRRLTHWIGPFPAGTGAPSALLGVVPVTPLEIESTERMARALRWTWYATWLLEMGRLTARIDERNSESQRSPRRMLGGISDEVVRVGELTRLLTPCPLCRKTKRVSFDPGQRGAFRYLCADCDGQWGIRICGTCQRLFPVLTDSKPAGANEDHDPYDTGDKIDARFGSDVLALPCPSFPDWTRFRCPWCGTCQGSPSCRCDYSV
jgi:uncharacterized protein DUF2357